MNHKNRMLCALTGRPIDELPWAPRLDLWYRANQLAGTLPQQYRNSSLIELVDDLDIGYHCVVPNFRDLRSQLDDADRALGIYNMSSMPCRTVLEGVERSIRKEGDRTSVSYDTPHGTITTSVLYNDAMRKAGITITHVEEYAFKGPADYAALGYIFENARVVGNYDGYTELARQVGDRGLAVAYANSSPAGMFFIQRELMRLNTFFYEMNDHPHEMQKLAEQIDGYIDRVMEVAAASPAEVVFVGANYDSSVTYPPFFAEYIMPGLKKCAEMLHKKGKFLLTHTDGENRGLLEYYIQGCIDIADSVCPAPMTSLSLKEVRDVFAGRITIMGGIPSVALLPSSMNDQEFEAFLDSFFVQIGDGRRLILGISDTTPPGASFDRILKITDRVRAFGPIAPCDS